MARPEHPVMLIVLDGWGVGDGGPHDAIHAAGCPTMTLLKDQGSYTTLGASGPDVGLPEGQMGNSEVGHLNLGAGRVVPQEIVRINQAIKDGSFYENETLVHAARRAKGHRLHILGLLGPGGVHSHQDHLLALLELAKRKGLKDVAVHHVLDGRDTPPKSALAFASALETPIAATGAGRVATVSGRYWTMDRDNRWERVQRAYELLVDGRGHRQASAPAAIEAAYARGESDEFVEPTIVGDPWPIRDQDVVVCYNFRPDRMRQIVRMLADDDFDQVPRTRVDARVVTLTMYDKTFEDLDVEVAFAPFHPTNTLGAHYAAMGLRQLRVAETEKYAHVTYFFNGGVEAPLVGEDRKLVPSPKVATYDMQPGMSASGITDALLERLGKGYDLIVVNFANADMVGHTGDMDATVSACKAVDECLGRIVPSAKAAGYVVAVTADHGNAERMRDAEGNPQTAHTTSRVPLAIMMPDGRAKRLRDGGALCNVAPTLLDLVGVLPPAEMDAASLLVDSKATARAG
jgi:2,3-bisphosphoglycerate-independent phosphoglycerate mutase